MADTISFNVSGLSELAHRLKSLSGDMEKKFARQATASGATVIKKAAIARAPVKTGALQKSIVIKRIPDNKSKLAAEYDVGVSSKQLKKYVKNSRAALTQLQGPQLPRFGSRGQILAPTPLLGRKDSYVDFGDFYYFRFIELGTVKAAARPFLRPAFAASIDAAIAKMAEVLRKRLDKAGA